MRVLESVIVKLSLKEMENGSKQKKSRKMIKSRVESKI